MRAERGIATAGAVLLVVLVVVVGVVGLQLAHVIGLRQQAAAAADLAALAASRASAGGEAGCAAAERVAAANHGLLIDCQMDADVATVAVRVTGNQWWGRGWHAEQRARAAPVSYLKG